MDGGGAQPDCSSERLHFLSEHLTSAETAARRGDSTMVVTHYMQLAARHEEEGDNKTAIYFLEKALQVAREAGRRCALATIVGTKGSTPRKVGARMLVDPETGLVGTVGGGCGEAEVIEAAHDVLKTGVARRVRVDLTDDFVSWSPAVCGGVMDIFLEAVDGRAS